MEKPNPIEHFSHSALDLFSRCGEAYRRRYLEGEKIPPGFALLRGTGVHRAAEANYRQKVASKEDLPSEAIADAARDAVKDSLERPYLVDLPDADEKGFKGKLVDSSVAMALEHRRVIAPGVQPVAVELELRARFPGFPREIVGFLDVVDSADRIRDVKTSGKKKTIKDVAGSTQLLLYGILWHLNKGVPAKELVIDNVVETKTGKRSAEAIALPAPGRDAYQPVLNRLQALQRANEAGVFSPAPSDSWMCSEKFCGYWKTCPYRSRVSVPVVGETKGGDDGGEA